MSFLFRTYAPLYDRFMYLFKLDQFQDLILCLESKKSQKIADVGGGTGTLANELIKLGHEVTIIDPCKRMTELAKKKNAAIRIHNATIQQEESQNNYDVIVFRDCLHHIKNQEETIQKAYPLLKPGGCLLIQEFSPKSFRSKSIFLFERLLLEKVYPISAHKLAKICERNGFVVNVRQSNPLDYILIGEKNE